jgi:hypothetical protein
MSETKKLDLKEAIAGNVETVTKRVSGMQLPSFLWINVVCN